MDDAGSEVMTDLISLFVIFFPLVQLSAGEILLQLVSHQVLERHLHNRVKLALKNKFLNLVLSSTV